MSPDGPTQKDVNEAVLKCPEIEEMGFCKSVGVLKECEDGILRIIIFVLRDGIFTFDRSEDLQ